MPVKIGKKKAQRAQLERDERIRNERDEKFMQHELNKIRLQQNGRRRVSQQEQRGKTVPGRLTTGLGGAVAGATGLGAAKVLTPEEQAAKDEVRFSNPKNKYKAQSGLAINGMQVARPQQYKTDYLEFAQKKNRKYYDDLADKKGRLVAGINQALAQGATMAPQMGSGSITMGDKKVSVSAAQRLSSMSSGDLEDLLGRLTAQVGAKKGGGVNKEMYSHEKDILGAIPKTIPTANGVGEMVNPAYSEQLEKFKNLGYGVQQGQGNSDVDAAVGANLGTDLPPIQQEYTGPTSRLTEGMVPSSKVQGYTMGKHYAQSMYNGDVENMMQNPAQPATLTGLSDTPPQQVQAQPQPQPQRLVANSPVALAPIQQRLGSALQRPQRGIFLQGAQPIPQNQNIIQQPIANIAGGAVKNLKAKLAERLAKRKADYEQGRLVAGR